MISLRLLGGLALEGDEGPLTGPAAQRHRRALLALLATSRSRGVSRDRLLAYLWPESDSLHARNLLKQAVHVLRQALGEGAIRSVGDELRLDPDAVACDVAAFNDALASDDLERAVGLYSGAFLDGFYLTGSQEFERWVEAERERLRRAYGAALETLAENAEASGDRLGAIQWWHRLAAEEPYNSRIALRLMQALDAAGDRAGAIQHAQVHAALLREEFDAEPDPDIAALAGRLRSEPVPRGHRREEPAASVENVQTSLTIDAPLAPGPVHPLPRTAPSAQSGSRRSWLALGAVGMLALLGLAAEPWSAWTADTEPSIAVLPFVNMSGDADEEYFSDGITEELIHTLTNVDGLRVTARTSAFQFKGKSVDVRDVGRQLGVATILEGSVRKSGDRLRITTQLVSAKDGSHLWSQAYDREVADVLAVQVDIARSIANTLRLQLTEAALLIPRHSEDREAYHLYLKGRHAVSQRTPAAVRQAIAYLEEAIARDPGYALAYSGLADSYARLPDIAGVPPGEVRPRILAAARRALELDPNLAEPHALLGGIYTDNWQWAEAETAFERALELDPDQPNTYVDYSLYLDNMGRFTEALEANLRAQQLDPLSPRISYNVAGSYLHLARFEPAIEEARRMIELHPNLPLGYDALGWALVDSGRPAAAIEPLERAVALGHGRWLALANLGRAYAGVGRRAEARIVLERLERDWGDVGLGNFAMAAVHLALGERERALERLERVYRLRHAKLPHVRQWTAFEPLYGDPEFTRLVREAGFEPPGPVSTRSALR
ncbi:MAG: BTAD domain-containing putative transcriptional regulator [Longimicrobiales bacterium]